MPNPVVHFEIIGKDAPRLRRYYGELFGWEADTDSAVVPEVSAAGNYGFISKIASDDEPGIPGGIGGRRVMGPATRPGGGLAVGHFTDPDGNLVGLAGPR